MNLFFLFIVAARAAWAKESLHARLWSRKYDTDITLTSLTSGVKA
jgi:hypothetical protein